MRVNKGGLCPGGKLGAKSGNDRRSKEVEVKIMGLERFSVVQVLLDGMVRIDRIKELFEQ
jgi:hypothetical protein